VLAAAEMPFRVVDMGDVIAVDIWDGDAAGGDEYWTSQDEDETWRQNVLSVCFLWCIFNVLILLNAIGFLGLARAMCVAFEPLCFI
jgi:hypothetical protein